MRCVFVFKRKYWYTRPPSANLFFLVYFYSEKCILLRAFDFMCVREFLYKENGQLLFSRLFSLFIDKSECVPSTGFCVVYFFCFNSLQESAFSVYFFIRSIFMFYLTQTSLLSVFFFLNYYLWERVCVCLLCVRVHVWYSMGGPYVPVVTLKGQMYTWFFELLVMIMIGDRRQSIHYIAATTATATSRCHHHHQCISVTIPRISSAPSNVFTYQTFWILIIYLRICVLLDWCFLTDIRAPMPLCLCWTKKEIRLKLTAYVVTTFYDIWESSEQTKQTRVRTQYTHIRLSL